MQSAWFTTDSLNESKYENLVYTMVLLVVPLVVQEETTIMDRDTSHALYVLFHFVVCFCFQASFRRLLSVVCLPYVPRRSDVSVNKISFDVFLYDQSKKYKNSNTLKTKLR